MFCPSILLPLAKIGVKVVAYADDVAKAVRVHFKMFANWTGDKCLRVKPTNTEIVLFNRKYKLPSVKPIYLECTHCSLRTPPSEALNVMLHLLPLDILSKQ